jgi:hypothetical protein
MRLLYVLLLQRDRNGLRRHRRRRVAAWIVIVLCRHSGYFWCFLSPLVDCNRSPCRVLRSVRREGSK